MKLETLDALSDPELQSVIARSRELLQSRDEERKAKALSDAKALLASVGLQLKDLSHARIRPQPKTLPYKAGVMYQHPTDASLTWNAKGQKPSWLRELDREGKRATEVAAKPANETIPTSIKKTG